MSLVERLAEKWLEAQGDDIEPTFDRNRTDSKGATRWWLNAIADDLAQISWWDVDPEIHDYLRSQANDGGDDV